ncbi:MAG TPA: cell division protein FtsZ, partial [Rhizobiales bacterium]|nr:cell division protein FtsZ [Hyphomicrobiales bacterium]
MTINLTVPNLAELKPRITVFGVGGAGGNAVNNMIESRLEGVEFVVANTDAQALTQSSAERRIQMGNALTQGLGAGSQPQVGAGAAEEALPEIMDQLAGAHMVFVTAGMGGGTGTGAAPVIARAAKEQGILTVGVVTKPFHFEGQRRMATAERGIEQLTEHVDTLIVIPNQNLFRVANEKTTFSAAFAMADQVLYSGVASITELMTREGLINLDFADVRAIMSEMGKAMMGTGEASGEKRAIEAAEAAIANPLLDDVSMRGARGLLISISGGNDLTLYEVDEAATRIREEVDPAANIILGATFDETLEGTMRVSVVATGLAEEEAELSDTDGIDLNDDASRAVYGYSGIDNAMSLPPAQAQPAPAQQPQTQPQATTSEPSETSPVAEQTQNPETAGEAPAQPEMFAEPAPAAAPRQEVAETAPMAPKMPKPAAQPEMPKMEDFPPIARQQMQAREQQVNNIADKAQKKRKGLLERLASVGLGAGAKTRQEPSVQRPT